MYASVCRALCFVKEQTSLRHLLCAFTLSAFLPLLRQGADFVEAGDYTVMTPATENALCFVKEQTSLRLRQTEKEVCHE